MTPKFLSAVFSTLLVIGAPIAASLLVANFDAPFVVAGVELTATTVVWGALGAVGLFSMAWFGFIVSRSIAAQPAPLTVPVTAGAEAAARSYA